MALTRSFFYLRLLVLLPLACLNAAEAVEVLTLDKAKALRAVKGDKQLVVLWSLSCTACFKELALLSDFNRRHPDRPVVLINTDDSVDQLAAIESTIAKYQLQALVNYRLPTAQADAVSFALDPNWYGELPRSYFVDEQGVWLGKSGKVSEAHLLAWFGL